MTESFLFGFPIDDYGFEFVQKCIDFLNKPQKGASVIFDALTVDDDGKRRSVESLRSAFDQKTRKAFRPGKEKIKTTKQPYVYK